MAEECTATSPTLHSWWDIHHATSLSPWTINPSSWHHHQNPNSHSSSCDQDDVLSISTSFTNASNHSVLTSVGESSGGAARQLVDPNPSNDLISGEHGSDNHLWSHVLSNVGSNGELRNGADVAENLFETISSKSNSSAAAAGIFEPACDYLKKIDGNWEFSNSSVFNNFIKNMNEGFDSSSIDHNEHQSSIESESLTKLSNMVNHWSIAPPDPQLNPSHLITHKSSSQDHISLTSTSMETYSQQPVFLSCYGNGNHHHHHHHQQHQHQHDVKMEAPSSYLRRAFKADNKISNGYHLHNNLVNDSISMEADNFYGSMSHPSSTSNITYGRINKPFIDIHASSKPSFIRAPLNLSDCKKQAANSLQTRTSNGRTQGTANEGKKKRGEEASDSTAVVKKSKHENSAASSVKMHSPKVKLGDRITALQQIVSPFGKTDTASVLLEAIGYINFLHEQVQLLSNPYMKLNSHKDPWGISLDRKDENGEMKVDLRGRGLCLVPISCTPKVYHENTGPDYWSPTYRGCLYR